MTMGTPFVNTIYKCHGISILIDWNRFISLSNKNLNT